MKQEIMAMAERKAAHMVRTDAIYGMDEADIIVYFKDRMTALVPKCSSSDFEGQRKFFSKVLANARKEILRHSQLNRRKLHMTDDEYANALLLACRQNWREMDEKRVKRVIPRLSPGNRVVAEAFVSAEWRHMTVNEFLGPSIPREHVTLAELAKEFGLPRTTFIRTRWMPMVEEFKKVWSLTD